MSDEFQSEFFSKGLGYKLFEGDITIDPETNYATVDADRLMAVIHLLERNMRKVDVWYARVDSETLAHEIKVYREMGLLTEDVRKMLEHLKEG